MVPLLTAEETKEARNNFLSALERSPEFKNFDARSSLQPVLGGFAAMGNPSSYHDPFFRQMAEIATQKVFADDILPVKGRRVEKCFDRSTLRRKGQKPTAESLHRDESATAHPDDHMFGGWINLDGSPQLLRCCPGSHKGVTGNKGFARITDPWEKVFWYERLKKVHIPPGHMLVFYERLVHDVVSDAAKHDMHRVHVGFRVTKEQEPLFGEKTTHLWMTHQAVPRIKSGQEPRVFPSCYTNFPKVHMDFLQKWSSDLFVPDAIEQFTVGSGDLAGRRTYRVPAKFPSLAQLSAKNPSIKLHPAYADSERMLRFPTYEKTLRGLDGTYQRWRLPTPEQWRAYLECQKLGAPSGARRPMPKKLA